jgi:prepilin-type processing-associated H-X9-DG protein
MSAFTSASYPDPATRRLSAATNTSLTVLIADVCYRYNHPAITGLDAGQVGFKHNARANMLFFDGHVSGCTEAETKGLRLSF